MAVRAMADVRSLMQLKPGFVISYVVETQLAGKSRTLVSDTVTIVNTAAVLLMRSSQGTSIIGARIGYQIADQTKRIVVYSPSKELEKLTMNAHKKAMDYLLNRVQSAANQSCTIDSAQQCLIVTSTFIAERYPTPNAKMTVVSGSSEHLYARQTPEAIALRMTRNGEFLSISSTYDKSSPYESSSISNLKVRPARSEEIATADKMIDNIISARGVPKEPYQGYIVLDLRQIGR